MLKWQNREQQEVVGLLRNPQTKVRVTLPNENRTTATAKSSSLMRGRNNHDDRLKKKTDYFKDGRSQ